MFSPFDAAVAFGTAMQIFEFALDGVLLTDSLLGELHVGRVECICELAIFAMVAVAAHYD